MALIDLYCPQCNPKQQPRLNTVIKYGTTTSGIQRYQCKLCKKTFTETEQTTGQVADEKDVLAYQILIMLAQGMPLNIIAEQLGRTPEAILFQLIQAAGEDLHTEDRLKTIFGIELDDLEHVGELATQSHQQAPDETEHEGLHHFYQTIVEASPDSIAVVQGNHLVYINPAFTRLFGYTKEDIKNKFNMYNLTVEAERNMLKKRYRDRLAGKPVSTWFRNHAVAKDGTVIPVETAAQFIVYNNLPAALIFVRDLRDITPPDPRLVSAEQRVEALLTNPLTGIIELDTSHVYSVNEKGAELLGMSVDEVMKFDLDLDAFASMVHPDDRDFVRAYIEHLRLTGQSEGPITFRLTPPDGRMRTIEAYNSTVWHQGKRIIQSIFTVKD